MNLQEFMNKVMANGKFISTQESAHYIRVNYKGLFGIHWWKAFDKETGERVA